MANASVVPVSQVTWPLLPTATLPATEILMKSVVAKTDFPYTRILPSLMLLTSLVHPNISLLAVIPKDQTAARWLIPKSNSMRLS